ncbi:MAG: hypothetical protein R2734_19255 [Nocardioides sp.]
MSPASGFLTASALSALPDSTVVLLRDIALTRDPDHLTAAVPAVVRVDDRQVLLSATRPAAGGPGPDDPLATVSLRQRILAEAAVRRLTRTGPLVLTLPTGWRPDAAAAGQFFAGLDVPWLRLATLADVAERRGRAVAPERVRYSERQAALELPPATLAEVAGLVDDGGRLDSLLPGTDTVADQVARAALPAASYAACRNARRQSSAVAGMRGWVAGQLGRSS